MQIPPVSYLPTPDGHIGWQSWGDGELVILDTGPSFLASIEDVPDQQRFLRWVTGLAGIGRLLRYDPPGVGTSDAGATPPTYADWADAAVRVLDAAGVERAAVLGVGATSFAALRLFDVAGVNVHIAARVAALAESGEVLVSTTIVDLVAGSPFAFEDRGLHELKGVPGARQVWAAREA